MTITLKHPMKAYSYSVQLQVLYVVEVCHTRGEVRKFPISVY